MRRPRTPNPNRTLIPLPVAADRLGISVQVLRQAVNEGSTPSVLVRKRRYLTEEIIADLLTPKPTEQ